MSQGSVPLAQAQAWPISGPRFACQRSGDDFPPAQRGSWESMAFRGFG